MLLEPDRTPYDMRFRLAGTDVRVHPLFWLFSAIFGWDLVSIGLPYLFLWVVAAFFSILLHELGHVWMGRVFGSDGYIVLYAMGGLAVRSADVRERWQRVLVFLAGPGIQLLLWAALWLGLKSAGDQVRDWPLQVRVALHIVMDINLYWPLLNLVPVWPLDGGRVTREFCTWLSRDGVRISLGISVATAAVLAVNSLAAQSGKPLIPHVPTGGWYLALFFGVLAYESYLLMRQPSPWRYEEADDRLPWER